MKKLNFIFIGLMLLSHVTLAGELKVLSQGTTFKVVYKSNEVCDTKIAIVDANGVRIFSETIQDMCSFIRPYDFSKLPYGEYTIIASNEFGKETTKADYDEKKDVEPVFHVTKLKGNRYLLGVPYSGTNKICFNFQ